MGKIHPAVTPYPLQTNALGRSIFFAITRKYNYIKFPPNVHFHRRGLIWYGEFNQSINQSFYSFIFLFPI